MPTMNRAAVLTWCGAALSPFLLYSALLLRLDPATTAILLLLGLALLTGVLRRQPAVALGLLLFVLALVTLDGERGTLQRLIQVLLAVTILGVVGLLAAVRPRRVSVTAAVLALAVGLLLIGAKGPLDVSAFSLAALLGTVTAWVIGDSIRQRTAFAAAQRAQSEAAAVESERLRIARELHDMIAHSIGVIAIQAGMGRRVIGTQPAAAQDALAAIEETSRETLAALRRMLGTLRRTESGPGGTVELAPAPGLSDLGGLVSRTRDAGIHVEIAWLGTHDPLPPDVDLSAFRIIQEAVTNVIRHSSARHCTVVLTRTHNDLTIEITDDGVSGTALRSGLNHGHSTTKTGHERADQQPAEDQPDDQDGKQSPGLTGSVGSAETGHGLVGMRERVNLLAGDFSAGPRLDGGFRVSARIPVPA